MNKLSAALQALQQGKALVNAVRAKQWQAALNAGVALGLSLLNLAPLFGVPLPPFLTPDVFNTLAILFGANAYATVATTDKIGLPSAPAQEEPRS